MVFGTPAFMSPEQFDDPSPQTRVVPLENATFEKSGGVPGRSCIAAIQFDCTEELPQVEMIYSQHWYSYRRDHWFARDEHRLICPDLTSFVG